MEPPAVAALEREGGASVSVRDEALRHHVLPRTNLRDGVRLSAVHKELSPREYQKDYGRTFEWELERHKTKIEAAQEKAKEVVSEPFRDRSETPEEMLNAAKKAALDFYAMNAPADSEDALSERAKKDAHDPNKNLALSDVVHRAEARAASDRDIDRAERGERWPVGGIHTILERLLIAEASNGDLLQVGWTGWGDN